MEKGWLPTSVFLGFPGGSADKESACSARDLGSIPGLGRSPGGGHGNPLQYSCLENPRGQRSLAGYSSWDCKESDMTERLSTAQTVVTDGPPKQRSVSLGMVSKPVFFKNILFVCIFIYLTVLGLSCSMWGLVP